MYCTKCGKQLEDGTKFCIFCGTKQEEAAPAYEAPTPTEEFKVKDAAPVYQPPKFEEPKFDYAPPVNNEPAPAKKKGKGGVILSIVLGILVLALLALNAYQYFVMSADIKDDLSASEKELKAVSSDLADLEDEYSDLQDDYDALLDSSGVAADAFEKLCDYVDYNVIGIGSKEFFPHRSAIVISEGDTAYFTVTCAYTGNVTINLSIEGDDIVDANFSGDWTGDETDVVIEGLSQGVALIEFTNDLNSDTFSVLVIVVD